jgi:MoaA/NifB/PqqE/SkfB family radical SAM enzyme
MIKSIEASHSFTKIVASCLRGKVFKLNFAVTYKCNSHCKMCNVWKRYVDKPWMASKELKIEEIDLLFQKFQGLVWVSITGGEPFLRSDLGDIACLIRDNCRIKMLNLTTNGLDASLMENTIYDILEAKVPLTFINISLDGPPEVHEYIRGVKGAFSKAVKTIEMLHALSKEFNNLSIGFEYTITPFNAGCLKSLIEVLTEKDLHWLLENITVTMYHKGNLYDNLGSNQQGSNGEFKAKALEDLFTVLNFVRGRSPLTLVTKTYLKFAQKYALGEHIPLSCVALRSSLFLNPYGEVYPCIILDKKVGDLRDFDYDVHALLRSEAAVKLRDQIKGCENCWTPCEAYPSILVHPTSLIRALK